MKLLEILVISTISFSIFYAFYLLLSKRQRSFSSLRFYLIFALLVSMIFSFLDLEMFATFGFQSFQQETTPQIMLVDAINTQQDGSEFSKERWSKQDFPDMAIMVWFFVTGFLLVRLLLKLITILILILKSDPSFEDGLKIIYNTRFQGTFSFFNWVFMPANADDKRETRHILAHEKVHARQFHSIDLILAELFVSFHWFNPLSWMMLRSLQLLHEYQADEGTLLQTGIQKTDYQALLINQVAEEKLVSLSSSFNQSLIKKRIIMMTKRNQKTSTSKRMLFAIPLTIVVVLMAALLQSFLFIAEPIKSAGGNNTEMDQLLFTENYEKENSPVIRDSLGNKVMVVKYIQSENSTDTIRRVVYAFEEENEKVLIGEDGNVTVSGADFSDVKPDSLENNIVEVRVMGKEKQTFSDSDGNTTVHTNVVKSSDTPENILYVIDGVQNDSKDALMHIEPSDIDSIKVYKGDKKKLYTEKDYEGVIVITTKKN